MHQLDARDEGRKKFPHCGGVKEASKHGAREVVHADPIKLFGALEGHVRGTSSVDVGCGDMHLVPA